MAIYVNGKLVAGGGGTSSGGGTINPDDIKDLIKLEGGGVAQLNGENFGEAPFVIEFSEEEETNNGNGGGSNSASDITYNNQTSGATSANVQGAIDELFTSVSEGKSLIASAITDKGVNTSADASFQVLHDNILAIKTDGELPDDVYTITLAADPPEGGTVSGSGYASTGMTCNAKAEVVGNYIFNGWKENGEIIYNNPLYSFSVNTNRSLTANFYIPQYISGRDWWEATLPSSAYWYSVTYGSSKFVAVTFNSDKAAYSTDGITWAETTLPSSTFWIDVTYGNDKFVAVISNSNKAAYSIDGITWVETTLPSSTNLYSVTYGNGKFVGVMYASDRAAYSTDGITWTETTLPSSANWQSVTYGDGKFVAVAPNSDKVAYSIDGITWTETTLPSSADWNSVAYGNGKFVAVASDSTKAAYSYTGNEAPA